MEKLTYEQVLQMDLPNIIGFATPIMIGLVLLEWGLSQYKHRKNYDAKDTFAAAVIGAVNLVITAAIKVATFGIIIFFYNLAPIKIEPSWWGFILCLVWIDFWRYWAHRIAHTCRFWWATHVTHHNSEKYNFSVSFRLSWTQHIKIVFFIPVALIGFDPVTFFICHQIEVLYQFWIHTEYIKKLPKPIEYIFVTPSHHRVHHGRNSKYLDKNYGSTFIFWDRLFGTFQPEEETPEYGITTPVNSYNPVYLNFHEWMDIIRDVRNSRNFKQAMVMILARPSRIADKKKEFGID